LVRTDLPLAQIAFAVGFFDQGHLARHFRHMVGTTRIKDRRFGFAGCRTFAAPGISIPES
jgi:transcriptional regulator GlxA family with amidase domain